MIHLPRPLLHHPAMLCVSAVLLASCADQSSEQLPVQRNAGDPVMDAALADQIMVDPDMVNRNGANQLASYGTMSGALPQTDRGAQAARAARDEALALVGGTGAMRRAPQPQRMDGELPPEARLSVAARAASAGEGSGDCAASAQFSATWAARLPQAFPVYPRGAVQEAAGSDAGGCSLRVVNFTTPVALGDVMDFYYTRATVEGFEVERIHQDGEDILGGTNAGRSFMVFARLLDDGMTSVDLVTTGGV
ncbi:hypothetical protein [Alteraurantiacibacter aquimixticola]|uniref:Uncharacterized protein n=1 Tax=Alteraurantiacibacter aquimixticola TaxID=2489173 RepID=A0A4T3F348_9SPHN|nr:hypothetical protein [Alteraurantiacibacter aquimixticola]TIX50550.1 hypothetical protein E5222_09800 [Alteraurantiacibacter aquimixticola]